MHNANFWLHNPIVCYIDPSIVDVNFLEPVESLLCEDEMCYTLAFQDRLNVYLVLFFRHGEVES